MAAEVLVTGANRGIGLEFVRQFAGRGDRVVATCRNPEAATELAGLGVDIVQLDVNSAADVAALPGLFQARSLDLLVNNAGIGVRSLPLGELDYDQMALFYATNAIAPLRIVETMLPAMRRGDGRTIVNMTSRMGSIRDNTSGGAYAYRASKAALNAINKSLAIDLGPDGFVSVVLHPGWVQTDMGGESAPVTTEQSVAGLIKVIDGLDRDDNGGFFDFTGEPLPW